MAHTELWLTYHLASRADRPSTAQLVELEFQNHKISDLEDVLEYGMKKLNQTILTGPTDS